jgi:predicted dehydrogenase
MAANPTDVLNLGIIGTGNIAEQFAAGLAHARHCRATAVGSRSAGAASAFASRFNIPRHYGSYDELLADPAIQAVYISLPNSMHHQWTLRALGRGKHVLCEKPLAVNSREAQEMFDAAHTNGLRLMEAFMYVSHPQTKQFVQQIRDGAIGKLQLLRTSFCDRTRRVEGNVRFDKKLAGGALMDVGCYCIHLATLLAHQGGMPTGIHAVARMHESGVDEQTSGVLCGDGGYLTIPWPWKPTQKATWRLSQGIAPRQDNAPGTDAPPAPAAPVAPVSREFIAEAPAPLYALEADEFAQGVLNSADLPVSPHQSLLNMRILDQIRHQIGLTFDADQR